MEQAVCLFSAPTSRPAESNGDCSQAGVPTGNRARLLWGFPSWGALNINRKLTASSAHCLGCELKTAMANRHWRPEG